MAVERVTIDLPPELKYWLDKRVRERKARGDRKASLRALFVELLKKEAKTTSAYPVVA
jgi:Arc/MetJ-type ribon-helix-helix transcriptional regulator